MFLSDQVENYRLEKTLRITIYVFQCEQEQQNGTKYIIKRLVA